MISLLLTFLFFNLVFSFEPSCRTCKHFIFNNNDNPELGLCTYFIKKKNDILYNFSYHCRNDPQLCGENGLFYEPFDILATYDELMNKCSGEVNETYELEQLEREFVELYQRMKKHNIPNNFKEVKKITDM